MPVQYSCYGVEEIVGEEEDHEGVLETTPPQFVFPNVRKKYPLHTYAQTKEFLSGIACFALAITEAIGGV